MTEFKIQVEESIVQALGYKQVEYYLQDFAKKLLLKVSAQDVLEDLQTVDLQNDKEWQTSRDLAWQQEKHKYLVSR